MSAKTIVRKMPDIVAEKYNDPNAMIRFRIVSIDMETRIALVQIALMAMVNNKLERVENFQVEAKVTEYTMTWLTKKKPVYVDGVNTGEYLSGYRKFLATAEQNSTTPLNALQFQCINHSPNYYANPFRLTIHKEYDSATLQLVNMPSLTKAEKEDPISGETSSTWYYKRHKDTKEILKLNKENYRRIEIR